MGGSVRERSLRRPLRFAVQVPRSLSMSPIVPCIWLSDQAEQAAAFYTKTFPGGRITATSRYPESRDNPGGMPRGSILTVAFEVAGLRFTALNGGPIFTPNPSVSFFVHVETAGEAERLFTVLADLGEVLMPLDKYPWSERYGWATGARGLHDRSLPDVLRSAARQGRRSSARVHEHLPRQPHRHSGALRAG
jgi:predicted 3-demethylubiquinone-9 3-methyltransferase (glyoxalase superfamily)